MSKHNILTEAEFAEHIPNTRMLAFLEDYCSKKNAKRREVNVLDWGCGRGKDVLWLKEEGYNAFGVDIDPEPIQNGEDLFRKKGYSEPGLSLIDHRGRTIFPDNYFHFVFSNQVFEHITDIEVIAKEFQRITEKSGMGYHAYPAHRYIVEGHLFMPFVHWLPKNRSRKYLIIICILFGCEPKWKELNDKNLMGKAKIYYSYSVNKTFYRKYSDIRKIFETNGFAVNFDTINNPKLSKYRLLHKLTHYRLSRKVIDYLLLTFKSVELLLTKL
jgi:ubiquinone/menaquinone biosynthesis C-methylase UbiE